MSVADTQLDLTVLDDLDFQPACEWVVHDDLGIETEEATHIGRLVCPNCRGESVNLLGRVCTKYLATHTVRCGHCRQGGQHVTLTPL